MPTRRRTITDAAALKALAHPLRMDLLERLVLHGPHTATQLAGALGQSPSNCSWHLRKLAEHGFVEEVEGASGRNRPWRAASEGLTWGEEEEAPEEASAAGRGLTDLLLTRELQRLRQARAAEHQEPAAWRRAASLTQATAWLTAEEATEISEHLRELLLSRLERTSDPSLRPRGARLVSMVAWLAPRPDQPSEAHPASGSGPDPSRTAETDETTETPQDES